MTHNNKAFIVSLCTIYRGFFKRENRHTIRVLGFGWMHLRKEPPLPSWKDLHESHQPWLNFFEFSFRRRKWIEWKFKKKKKIPQFPLFWSFNERNGKFIPLFGRVSVRLPKIIFANLFYYLAYFCYYSWVLLYYFS